MSTRHGLYTAAMIPAVAALLLLAAIDCAADFGGFKGILVNANHQKVASIRFLGQATFPTVTSFEGTLVGGLSGIAHDAEKNVYYAISDDRGLFNPARYYELTIDVADGRLSSGDILFTGVKTLLDGDGRPFPAGSIDPEGIALAGSGNLFISSEGSAAKGIAPFVALFSPEGRLLRRLPTPGKYLPSRNRGIRDNLAFESLTLTPNGHFLITAVENALVQDGPAADPGMGSPSRILVYDVASGKPAAEYIYVVEAVPKVPDPPEASRVNGLVELLAIDDAGTMLALERAYSAGRGNTVKLFEVLTKGAANLSGNDDLIWKEGRIQPGPAVHKRELLDFANLGITPDNLEGMTLGPRLADGRRVLIVVSDNNFNPAQRTQFIALALEFETIPAARTLKEH